MNRYVEIHMKNMHLFSNHSYIQIDEEIKYYNTLATLTLIILFLEMMNSTPKKILKTKCCEIKLVFFENFQKYSMLQHGNIFLFYTCVAHVLQYQKETSTK